MKKVFDTWYEGVREILRIKGWGEYEVVKKEDNKYHVQKKGKSK